VRPGRKQKAALSEAEAAPDVDDGNDDGNDNGNDKGNDEKNDSGNVEKIYRDIVERGDSRDSEDRK